MGTGARSWAARPLRQIASCRAGRWRMLVKRRMAGHRWTANSCPSQGSKAPLTNTSGGLPQYLSLFFLLLQALQKHLTVIRCRLPALAPRLDMVALHLLNCKVLSADGTYPTCLLYAASLSRLSNARSS